MTAMQLTPSHARDILDVVYSRGNKAAIIESLNPRETERYWVLDCPRCESRKAFLYKNGGKIKCSKADCGYEANLVRFVAGTEHQPTGEEFKSAVVKLAYLAGVDPGVPMVHQAIMNVSPPAPKPTAPVPQPRLEAPLIEMRTRLFKSQSARRYLAKRGIPLSLASKFEVGYAPFGKWPHRSEKTGKLIRQWHPGRIVFPIRDAKGRLINLYGRVAGDSPKHMRHDFLAGSKGIFNQVALTESSVIIFEGVIDALSMIAAGYLNSSAVSGMHGIPWHLVAAKDVLFGFDPEAVKSEAWNKVLESAKSNGKRVYFLKENTFAGHDDLNAVWVANRKIKLAVGRYA